MANYKNVLLAVFAVVIVGLIGFIVVNGNKPVQTENLPASTKVDSQEQEVATHPSDWIEYKNDQLGFSFWYPSSYGTVSVQLTDKGIMTGDAGRILVKSFQGYFLSKNITNFFGGVPCIDCEPVNFVTKDMVDQASKQQPIFKTDFGVPVYELIKPCTKEDVYNDAQNEWTNCPSIELIGYGQYLIKLDNDYNGVVFHLNLKDNGEAILKTFKLK